MKKRILSVLVIIILVIGIFPLNIFAETSDEIIILYESDSHCEISGYSKLASLKSELKTPSNYVGIVSIGDYIQGGTIGTISRGEYIIQLMNLVGYDAVALGNHEFDYKMDRLLELSALMDTKPICSNLQKISSGENVFEPYSIVSYGDIDIAYIGITTPDTITLSSPAQFKDDNGEYIYTFNGDALSENVQKSIDAAKAAGAEYIIGLSHLGSEHVQERWTVQTLIKNTSGFDAIIDGHSHSVIEQTKIADKNGKDVLVTSSGTKFSNIGKVTISDGNITSSLISLDTYQGTNEEIDNCIAKIGAEYSALGEREIGTSSVNLLTVDEDGNRIIRNSAANIGDFCSDAFRTVLGSDIAVINGGGIRGDVHVGKVTFNDILGIFPFNNTICVAKVTGQVIKDMLEFGSMVYPKESGSIQHSSGLTYKVHADIPSSVNTDENENFVSVDGDYRVYDIKVLNSSTGEYEEIKLDKYYTIAAHNFLLLDCGSGMTMFSGAEIVKNEGILDVEVLEKYIVEHLNGNIGEQYATAQNRIEFVTSPEYEYPKYPEYTVTFVVDGNTVSVQTVKQGESAVAPEIPQKEGYSAAWDKDGKEISADTVITAVYTALDNNQSDDTVDLTWLITISVSCVAVLGTIVSTLYIYNRRKNKKQ